MVLTQHKSISPNGEHLNDFVHIKTEKSYSLEENLDIDLVTLHMLTVKTKLLQESKVRITEKCFYVDVEFVIWSIYLSNSVRYFDIPLCIELVVLLKV